MGFNWQHASQNQLLATLPGDVRERLAPHLELVRLTRGQILYDLGDTVRYVHFPTDAMVALAHVTEDGAATEVSVVGNEGIVGIPLVTGSGSASSRAVVPSAGYAYRLVGSRIEEELQRHGALTIVLLRYMQALITQVAQTAICNRHHSIAQQLCRRLLLSLDCLPGSTLAMTQEGIATMLGVRREGITDAASKLQKEGVIQYQRGIITVLDRPRLERLSCECYGVVKRETQRLLPYDLQQRGPMRQSPPRGQDVWTPRQKAGAASAVPSWGKC